MRRKILLGFALMSVLLVFVVTPVLAQALPSADQILAKLAPRRGQDLLLDLLLYTIFGIGLITMMLVPDKQLLPSLMMVGVLMASLVGKLDVVHRCDLLTLGLNAFMFAIPLMVAGLVRGRAGKTPKALWPAILTGIVGGGYFFLFWFMKQQDCPPDCTGLISCPPGR